MLPEIEGSYSPIAKADIAYMLMDVDNQGKSDVWARTIFTRIKPRYGIYFAEIEKLCREYELTAHFLAVPTYLSLENNPSYIVVDANGKGIFRPFLALCCEYGLGQLHEIAQEAEIPYEKETNLLNLKRAGMYALSLRLYPSNQIIYYPN
jgi:hypothetical protein